jgi:hypothetical protein
MEQSSFVNYHEYDANEFMANKSAANKSVANESMEGVIH